MSSPSSRTPGPATPDGAAGPLAVPLPWWRRPLVWVLAAVVVAVAAAVGIAASRSATAPDPSSSRIAQEPSRSPEAAPEDVDPSVGPEPTDEATGSPDEPTGTEPGATEGSEPVERATAAPVPLDEPAQPAAGVSATLERVEQVEGEANLPGEVGGPSLRITVTVDNGTDAELDLTTAVVNLYHGADGAPAITLLEPGHEDFPTSVAPGERASGVFVFLVPQDRRGEVLVELDLSSEATVVLFQGAA